MKKDITVLIDSLNYFFDRTHYLVKDKRSIESLDKTLRYTATRYKDSINKIQELYSTKRNKLIIDHKKFELIACSIAVKGMRYCSFGTSYRVLKNEKYNKEIKFRLDLLGEIGKPSIITCSDNIIGKCAEIKAANNVMNKENKMTLKKLEFTKAIRPRTQEAMDRCDNCNYVFGYEK